MTAWPQDGAWGQVEGGVALLTLSRPEKRNALDTRTVRQVLLALQEWATDDAVRVVVLAGEGKSFCAGADLTEFRGASAGDEKRLLAERTELLHELVRRVEHYPKPLGAAVNGAAVGMGAVLVLAADFALFGENARLAFPEVAIGRVPTVVVPPLVRAVGPRQAFALLMEGRVLDAQGAVAHGLASRVVDDEQVVTETLAAARNMAQLDPAVVRATKALIEECSSASLQ